MNKTVTSKEELLQASYEIISQEGSGKLNIRSLAKKCNISIGSVYNYFPSKSELILAVSEEFWKNIFHPDMCQFQNEHNFSDAFRKVYDELCKHLPVFRSLILSQYEDMNTAIKDKGRQIEQVYLAHMKKGFVLILEKDPYVRENIWNENFTPDQFIDFLFQNMFTQLSQGITDCSYIIQIIERILYLEQK